MRTFLFPALLVIAGCGPAVDRVAGRDSEAVLVDLKRLEATLPPQDRAAFGKAHRVLLGITVLEHQDDIDKMQHAIRRRFNGKSASEIVAEYEGLEPAVREQFAVDREPGAPVAQDSAP